MAKKDADREAQEARAKALEEQVEELLEGKPNAGTGGGPAKPMSPRDFIHSKMAKPKKKPPTG